MRYYDGNGREVKRGGRDFITLQSGQSNWVERAPIYYIRSSILGNEVISEVDASGRRTTGYVRAARTVLAVQTGATDNPAYQYVYFEHRDVSATSYRSTLSNGNQITGTGYDGSAAEFDPFGGNMGVSTPYIELIEPPPPEYPTLQPYNYDSPMYVNGQRVTATLDGVEVPLGLALSALANGSAAQCPNNYCGSQVVINSQGQRVITSPFQAYADGRSGYLVPVWERSDVVIDGETDYGNPTVTWQLRETSDSSTSWSQYDFTPPSAKEFRKTVQEKYGKKFLECLKQELIEWAKKQKFDSEKSRANYLANINNLTSDLNNYFIDARLTSKELSKKYNSGYIRKGKFVPAIPYAIPDPYTRPYQTIRIGKQHWNDPNQWKENDKGVTGLEIAFIHEAGNIASFNFSGDYYAFGDDRATDPDSGHTIQKCVFGN